MLKNSDFAGDPPLHTKQVIHFIINVSSAFSFPVLCICIVLPCIVFGEMDTPCRRSLPRSADGCCEPRRRTETPRLRAANTAECAVAACRTGVGCLWAAP